MRGETKVVVLKEDKNCPNLVAFSAYNSKLHRKLEKNNYQLQYIINKVYSLIHLLLKQCLIISIFSY